MRPDSDSDPGDDPFSLLDYVQLACMSGRDVRIVIFSADDARVGDVELWKGRLWCAEDLLGRGRGALVRLLRHAQTFRVEVEALEVSDRGEHNLDLDCQEALMQIVGDEPAPDPTFADPELADKTTDELLARATEALLDRELSAAYEILRRGDVSDPRVRDRLKRLAELGHGEPID